MNARAEKNAKTLLEAAQALLARIDNLTTEQFSKGGERKEREALRAAITRTVKDQ